MEEINYYDYFISYIFKYKIIAFFAVIFVVLIAIPQVRDSLKCILQIFKKIVDKKDDKLLTLDYKGEKVILTTLLKSSKFDVVKIDAVTHEYGVFCQREWINKNYKGAEDIAQSLSTLNVDSVEKRFDIITINTASNKYKKIYFDISSFFNNAGCTSTRINEFAEHKIREIYSKKEIH